MLSVIGPLQFDGRDVAAVLVEAVMVEPVDPLGGGVFHLVDRPPGLARVDQLGLVQPIYRLREGIIVGRSDRSDRRLDPGFGEPLGEPDRRILGSSIRIKPNSA